MVVTSFWLKNVHSEAYNLIQGLLRSIIPLVILLISSYFIVNSVRKTRANKKLANRNRITIMLAIIILVFLICVTPDAVLTALSIGYAEIENDAMKSIREVTDTLLVINSSINFFIYYFFNQAFHREVCLLFTSDF